MFVNLKKMLIAEDIYDKEDWEYIFNYDENKKLITVEDLGDVFMTDEVNNNDEVYLFNDFTKLDLDDITKKINTAIGEQDIEKIKMLIEGGFSLANFLDWHCDPIYICLVDDFLEGVKYFLDKLGDHDGFMAYIKQAINEGCDKDIIEYLFNSTKKEELEMLDNREKNYLIEIGLMEPEDDTKELKEEIIRYDNALQKLNEENIELKKIIEEKDKLLRIDLGITVNVRYMQLDNKHIFIKNSEKISEYLYQNKLFHKYLGIDEDFIEVKKIQDYIYILPTEKTPKDFFGCLLFKHFKINSSEYYEMLFLKKLKEIGLAKSITRNYDEDVDVFKGPLKYLITIKNNYFYGIECFLYSPEIKDNQILVDSEDIVWI